MTKIPLHVEGLLAMEELKPSQTWASLEGLIIEVQQRV